MANNFARRNSGILSVIDMRDASKYLYAEDFVSYITDKIIWNDTPYSRMYIAPVSEQYRAIVDNNWFTDDTRKAIDIIQILQEHKIIGFFTEESDKNNIDFTSSDEILTIMKEYLSDSRTDAVVFLKYGVYITVLSSIYYQCGYKDMPDSARDLILDAFPEDIMSEVTWETLSRRTKSFVKQYEHLIENTTRETQGKEKCACFQSEVLGDSFMSVFEAREQSIYYHNLKCSENIITNQGSGSNSSMSQPLDQPNYPEMLKKRVLTKSYILKVAATKTRRDGVETSLAKYPVEVEELPSTSSNGPLPIGHERASRKIQTTKRSELRQLSDESKHSAASLQIMNKDKEEINVPNALRNFQIKSPEVIAESANPVPPEYILNTKKREKLAGKTNASHYQLLMKSFQDIYMKGLRNGHFSPIQQDSPAALPMPSSPIVYKSYKMEIMEQQVTDFFKNLVDSNTEPTEHSNDVNNLQLPDINYEILRIALNFNFDLRY